MRILKVSRFVSAVLIVTSWATWAAPAYALRPRQGGLEEQSPVTEDLARDLLGGDPDTALQQLGGAARGVATSLGLLPKAAAGLEEGVKSILVVEADERNRNLWLGTAQGLLREVQAMGTNRLPRSWEGFTRLQPIDALVIRVTRENYQDVRNFITSQVNPKGRQKTVPIVLAVGNFLPQEIEEMKDLEGHGVVTFLAGTVPPSESAAKRAIVLLNEVFLAFSAAGKATGLEEGEAQAEVSSARALLEAAKTPQEKAIFELELLKAENRLGAVLAQRQAPRPSLSTQDLDAEPRIVPWQEEAGPEAGLAASLQERIQAFIAEYAGKAVTAETLLAEDLNLDSLDIFELHLRLEEKFEIPRMPYRESGGWKTAQDVVTSVQTALAKVSKQQPPTSGLEEVLRNAEPPGWWKSRLRSLKEIRRVLELGPQEAVGFRNSLREGKKWYREGFAALQRSNYLDASIAYGNAHKALAAARDWIQFRRRAQEDADQSYRRMLSQDVERASRLADYARRKWQAGEGSEEKRTAGLEEAVEFVTFDPNALTPIQQLMRHEVDSAGVPIWRNVTFQDGLSPSDEEFRLTFRNVGFFSVTSNQTIIRKKFPQSKPHVQTLYRQGFSPREAFLRAYYRETSRVFDMLTPVRDWSLGDLGQVSMEATALAETEEELNQGLDDIDTLWQRSDVLAKLPNLEGVKPGLPHLKQAGPRATFKRAKEGKSANITLGMSIDHLLAHLRAYIEGVKALVAEMEAQGASEAEIRERLSRMHWVFSLFSGRLDRKLFDWFNEAIGQADARLDFKRRDELLDLLGKTSFAMARFAGQIVQRIFLGLPLNDDGNFLSSEQIAEILSMQADYRSLHDRYGARPVNLLLASSGRYPNQPYASPLNYALHFGPLIWNTLPPDTLDALDEYLRNPVGVDGRVRMSVEQIRQRNTVQFPVPWVRQPRTGTLEENRSFYEEFNALALLDAEELARRGKGFLSASQVLAETQRVLLSGRASEQERSLAGVGDTLRTEGARAFRRDEEAMLADVESWYREFAQADPVGHLNHLSLRIARQLERLEPDTHVTVLQTGQSLSPQQTREHLLTNPAGFIQVSSYEGHMRLLVSSGSSGINATQMQDTLRGLEQGLNTLVLQGAWMPVLAGQWIVLSGPLAEFFLEQMTWEQPNQAVATLGQAYWSQGTVETSPAQTVAEVAEDFPGRSLVAINPINRSVALLRGDQFSQTDAWGQAFYHSLESRAISHPAQLTGSHFGFAGLTESQRVAQLARTTEFFRYANWRAISRAKSGHAGGSLSAAEILTVLYGGILRVDPKNPGWQYRDRFVFSKGHGVPIQYVALAAAGFLPWEALDELRKNPENVVQGHPDVRRTPGVDFSTGALGFGALAALGQAIGLKLQGIDSHVVTLMGDGEIQGGGIWELFQLAPTLPVDNLIGIVDWNRYQQNEAVATHTKLTPDSLGKVLSTMDWNVVRIDAPSVTEAADFAASNFRYIRDLRSALIKAKSQKNRRPTVLIVHSLKGRGITEAEKKFKADDTSLHGKAPDAALYEAGLREIASRLGIDVEARDLALVEQDLEERGQALRKQYQHGQLTPGEIVQINQANDASSAEARERRKAPQAVALPTYEVGKVVATREALGATLAHLMSGQEPIVLGQPIRPGETISINPWDIVGLDFSDLGDSTTMNALKPFGIFSEANPQGRFIRGGIQETLGIQVTEGLSSVGMVPVIASFARFHGIMGRGILHAAENRHPILVVGTHAGANTGEDGPSNFSTAELAQFNAMGVPIFEPADAQEAVGTIVEGLGKAVVGGTPVVVQLHRNGWPVLDRTGIARGAGYTLWREPTGNNPRITLVAAGATVPQAIEASRILGSKQIDAGVIGVSSITEITQPENFFHRVVTEWDAPVLTVVDGVPGALGTPVLRALSLTAWDKEPGAKELKEPQASPMVVTRGLNRYLLGSGDWKQLYAIHRIGAPQIAEDVPAVLEAVEQRKLALLPQGISPAAGLEEVPEDEESKLAMEPGLAEQALFELDQLGAFLHVPEFVPGIQARPILLDASEDLRVAHLAQALSLIMAKDRLVELDFRLVIPRGKEDYFLEQLSRINRTVAQEFLRLRIFAYEGDEESRKKAREEALDDMARKRSEWGFPSGEDLNKSGLLKEVRRLTPTLAQELKGFFEEGELRFVSSEAFERLKALLEAA